jgi:hypothetical protein
VSSSKRFDNSGELDIGASAYVSLTDKLEQAQNWTDGVLWKFDICSSDLFPGGKEDEMLALGGTPIYNIYRSDNRGVTYPHSYGNGRHGNFTA